MLAVHWTPVGNTKTILKNGIRKNKKGLFCFPLTGHPSVDRWWVRYFNTTSGRKRKKYNGILFRITEADMPAFFGHWEVANNWTDFNKEINSTKLLGQKFRENLSFELGYRLASKQDLLKGIIDPEEFRGICIKEAEHALRKNPRSLNEILSTTDAMLESMSDFQIVLSHSIPPKRILRVIPQGNEFGKVLRKKKKEKWKKDRY
ncbi:MAG: hypothetical protein AAF696_18305 [Bacteroidota bacterium]